MRTAVGDGVYIAFCQIVFNVIFVESLFFLFFILSALNHVIRKLIFHFCC